MAAVGGGGARILLAQPAHRRHALVRLGGGFFSVPILSGGSKRGSILPAVVYMFDCKLYDECTFFTAIAVVLYLFPPCIQGELLSHIKIASLVENFTILNAQNPHLIQTRTLHLGIPKGYTL
jgi:hypothetical protein